MITVARAGTARYPRDEVHEVADFLEWLLKGNFVLLGAREYDFSDGTIRVVEGSGLGHPARRGALRLRQAGPAVRRCRPACASGRRAATCCWSPRRTRSRPCTGTSGWTTSACGGSRAPGEIVGESRLLGLFTSKAFAERASETPLLHRKLRQALEAEDLIEGSHDYKAAVALFDSFPKEELFSAPVDDLRRAVVGAHRAGGHRARAPARPPRLATAAASSLILSLPRSRYSAPLVAKMTKLLRAALRDATASRPTTCMDEGARVRVHFFVHAADGLDRRARARARGRGDRARAHVGRRAGRGAGRPAGAAPHLGRVLPGALQGLHDAAAGGDRHRLLRAAGRGRVVRRQPARARRGPADADRALQARRQDRALARDADARGPRAARDRGDLDAPARRRRDVGAGVPRARAGRAAARPRRRRRPRGRGDRGRLPRRRPSPTR